MGLSHYIKLIGKRKEIQGKPPVLVDIGASGDLNPLWKAIAGFSIGIAFDADDRDFSYEEKQNSIYKKLYTINRIVVDHAHSEELPFYLTKKPHCSSLLKPIPSALDAYDFASYFSLERVVSLKVVSLPETLQRLGIEQVDWFKTDSQGTDLRLFKSLPDHIKLRSLIVEFEPGLIDAYVGEDKLIDIMDYMRQQPFHLGQVKVKGPLFVEENDFNRLFPSKWAKKFARHSITPTPGWAELMYVNKLDNEQFTVREYLLGWMFASVLSQNGHALSIAKKGAVKFNDPLLADLKRFSEKQLSREPYSASGIKRLLTFALNKFL